MLDTSCFFSLLFALPLALTACTSVEVLETVTGTVIDGGETPVSGVRVQAGGAVVTTDAHGHFSLSSVASPYDVTLVLAGESRPYIYLGLTGKEPTFRIYDQRLSAADTGQAATIEIDLPMGEGSMDSAGYVVDRPDELAPIGVRVANPTPDGKIPVTVVWHEQGPTTVRVQAFRYQVDPVTGAPKHYTGYDTGNVHLLGGLGSGWTASWKAPPWKEAPVSVSTTLPAGYQIWQTALGLRMKDAREGAPIAFGRGSAAEVSFVAPAIDGAIFDMGVCAASAEASSCRGTLDLTAGDQGAALEVEPGPELLAPAAGADLGVGTEIQWATQGDGPVFMLLYPTQPQPAASSFFFAAAGESAVLPDLGALGVKLPAGLDYNLGVFRNGAVESVDELAAKGPFFARPGQSSTYAYSTPRIVKSR